MHRAYLNDFDSVSTALRQFQDQLAQREQFTRPLALEILETRSAATAAMVSLQKSVLPLKSLQDELALRSAAFEDVSKLLTKSYAPLRELDMVAPSISSLAQGTMSSYESVRNTLAKQLAEINRFSEYSLSAVDWQRLTGALGRVDEVARGTVQFSLAYQHLLESIEVSSARLNFSPHLEGLAAIEVFAHSNLLTSLDLHVSSQQPEAEEGEEAQEEEEGEVELRQRVSEESSSNLHGRLAARNTPLLPLWLGAKEALHSGNPDRVRHYCVSQRELLLKLLDEAAPDGEIKTWSSDPKHYKEGRPTRRAKLLYLNRDGASVHCTQFAVKDVKVGLTVFEYLNKGTHQVTANFSSRELTALQIRADNLMLFLLAMADKSNQ